jgi:hypothetical protein
MAELADAQDLGSCIERCVGSSPTGRTVFYENPNLVPVGTDSDFLHIFLKIKKEIKCQVMDFSLSTGC